MSPLKKHSVKYAYYNKVFCTYLFCHVREDIRIVCIRWEDQKRGAYRKNALILGQSKYCGENILCYFHLELGVKKSSWRLTLSG
jgi:hypothetical protein